MSLGVNWCELAGSRSTEGDDVRMLSSKDVTNQAFTPTQFRPGYDEREVDEFLDQVVETLRYYERGGIPGPQAPATSAHVGTFTSTKYRRGYDDREVDEFLDKVVEALRYYEQGWPARSARA